jgi:hypothetical protein
MSGKSKLIAGVLLAGGALWAQGPPGGFPGGFPGGGGPGGFPGAQEKKILKDFDADGDKRLNAKERAAAREMLAKEPRRGRFGPRGGQQDEAPPTPGPKLTPAQVKTYQSQPLYDMAVLRTIFIEFEDADWEAQMADFNNTDVEMPARVTVDGKVYPDVGAHFRGMSSFMMVGAGRKRSLNLSFDWVNKDQRLYGYRTLNLLNSHNDPTFLRGVLYLQAAREFIPAPKANFMRVVINGESWGIYPSMQQFNGDFLNDFYGSAKGARWKVPGSPMGRGGLKHLGDDVAAYKRIYEIKTKDDPKDWAALVNLTKVLTDTPADELVAKLEPIFDVEGALRFLALEKTLINSDGYWTRMSDYNIYLDAKGKFHIIPHDANETFAPPEGPPGGFGGGRGFGGPPPPGFGGPGGAGGPGGGPGGPRPPGGPDGGPSGDRPPRPPMGPKDAKLDLFAGEQDPNKALLNRLMSVPALRARYLVLCREIATKWLDWSKLEPMARKYQALIADDVAKDTRKLDSTENFTKALTEETQGHGFGPFGGMKNMSLKQFAEERRAFVLNYKEPEKKQP